MGKKPDLSESLRAKIHLLKEEGYSNEAIARRLKVAKGTVFNTLKRIQETGTLKSRQRTGRPAKTTKQTDRKIRRMVAKDPFLPASKIATILSEEGINLGVTQIELRLRNFGLSARRAAKKPLLTKKMRSQRRCFAYQYGDWNDSDWAKVLFSDESTFELNYQAPHLVRRPTNERYNPRYTLPTVKHPQKVMVWGCFSANNRGGLFFLPKGKMMNAAVYLDLLKDKLMTHMNILGCEYFLHDSAPCHKAKTVTSWLADRNVRVIQWPGNSPDLNPIENLWRQLKVLVSQDQPESLSELQESIRRHWCLSITPDFCRSLSNSMKNRIHLLKKSAGHPTKY